MKARTILSFTEFVTQAIWLMLDCIFSVLYLRSYSPSSSLLMRRSKTDQICFEKRTSTIPSLSASSRRNTSAQLIRVALCPQRASLPWETCPHGLAPAPARTRSAGVSHSHWSPKGNRQMRRILNQAANAAVSYMQLAM
jgi:hypothetical protein